jgi:hypothetical protein
MINPGARVKKKNTVAMLPSFCGTVKNQKVAPGFQPFPYRILC